DGGQGGHGAVRDGDVTSPVPEPPYVEDLLRTLAPQVLGALVRRYGHGSFDACEDAVQEALLAAAVQWTGRARPVPAPGRDRRRPRGGGAAGGHRLAADPRALPAAG